MGITEMIRRTRINRATGRRRRKATTENGTTYGLWEDMKVPGDTRATRAKVNEYIDGQRGTR